MNNPIIFQAGGGLLIISFLVILFFCARSWRIWHILFTFAVFGCAIWFCLLAAMSLKTRSTFRTQFDRLEKQLAERQEEVNVLLKGVPGDVKDETPSIRSIRGKMERELTGRGRVWRSCVPTNLAQGAVTLDTPIGGAPPPGAPGAPGAPAPAAPAPAGGGGGSNQLVAEDVLYAFLERDSPLGKEPWLYLGEFTATNVTPTTVTLAPLVPMDEVQLQAIQNWQNQTWVLYEVLPVDGHRTYAMDPEYQPDLDQEGESLFGEMNDAERMRLTTESRRLYLTMLERKKANATPEQQAVIDSVITATQKAFAQTDLEYQTDGKVVGIDDNRWDPADLWVKVRFLREHSVDVDTATNMDAINTKGYFDIDGRAQIESLQRGERDENGKFQPAPAEFEIDDVAVFDKATADQLIRDGIAEQVDTVFVRPTFDFARNYANHARRMRDLIYEIQVAQRDFENMNNGLQATLAEIATYETEKQKLEDDLTVVNREVSEVKAYQVKLAAEEAKARRELSILYRSNRELAERLRKLHAQLLAAHQAMQKEQVANNN